MVTIDPELKYALSKLLRQIGPPPKDTSCFQCDNYMFPKSYRTSRYQCGYHHIMTLVGEINHDIDQ